MVPRRPLGQSGLEVPVLGFGAGELGAPGLDEQQVARLLGQAVELGVCLFDAARSYGLAEERLGRHLRPYRGRVLLSTKVGYGISGVADWSDAAVARGVDEALARLQADVLDVVHLHSCPRWVLEQGAVVEALEQAKRAGKVRAIAYSGENEACEWAVASSRFDAIQCSVNLVDQRGASRWVEHARERGLGVLAKRPLANAVWRFDQAPARADQAEYWRRWRALALDTLLAGLGLPRDTAAVAEVALRFAAYTPGVSCALVATTRPERLVGHAESVARGALPDATRLALTEAFTRVGADWEGLV